MFVPRSLAGRFSKLEKVYPIIAVVGARQSGKTTFLKEQAKQVNGFYVLFDDPDVRGLFEEDVKKFEQQYIEGHPITVLDEVQYAKEAGPKLKYLADTNHKLWITSSSEIILGKKILSYLVGRVSILKMYPFSLREFLLAKNQKEMTDITMQRMIWEHATYGGYPKVVTIPDIETKKTILKDIHDTLILKDIAQTFSIEDIRKLEEFSSILAQSIGNILSYDVLSNQLQLTFQTVKKYFDAMEKSYLVARIPPFFTNKTKEITKQPKLYFVDTGLRNAIAKQFDTRLDGKLFENYVWTELVKNGFTPKYWRTKTKAEVDFVVELDNKQVIPIEVKLNGESETVSRSLRSFIQTYQPQKAFIVYYKGKKSRIKVDNCQVTFIPIHELVEQINP